MNALRRFAFAFAAALLVAPAAHSQPDYPARPIRIVAPVPPGSPPDVVARLLAEPLSQALGQPVVVDNRPGGNQTIGLALVAAAPADGYTLGVVSLPTAVVPSLMARMPYDTVRDFEPVRELAWTSNVLVVNPATGIGSLAELIAAAKSRPGKLSYASGGNGTPAHVMAELMRGQAGIDVVHVPFKGAPEGVNAVMAGHVDFMLASAGPVSSHVRSGKVRPLAQTTSARLAAYPDVPTFSELGHPGIAVRDWQGLVAPARTPAGVLKRIADSLGAALARADVQARLRAMAMEPVSDSGPDQFRAFFASEVRRWAAVAAEGGIQAQ